MAAPVLQLIQVRLAGHLVPLHFLRLAGRTAHDGYPGSELLCTADRRLLAAHSSGSLLEANRVSGSLPAPVTSHRLVIDAKRCRRALARPPSRWTGTTRGDLATMDDLLFDAAASLNDARAIGAISAREGFHGLYAYVWGQIEEPPPVPQRLWWWDQQMQWLNTSTHVLDPHRGRPAHRR